MIWPHPSRRRLRRWALAANDPKVQHHVEQCERCLEFVEDEAPTSELALGDVLAALLQAPDALEEELVARAEELRSRRAILEVLGGFVVLPWETVRIMTDERRREDG